MDFAAGEEGLNLKDLHEELKGVRLPDPPSALRSAARPRTGPGVVCGIGWMGGWGGGEANGTRRMSTSVLL